MCALLPLQSHTTAGHGEISFSYLETVTSDGKMGQVLFVQHTGIKHLLSANGGRAGGYANETQSLSPCGSQTEDRRPTGLGTAARDGA